jgi:hypothetical protein
MHRPDFSTMFDREGNSLPATSSDDTHAAMVRGDAPTPEQSAAILGSDYGGVHTKPATPVPAVVKGDKGNFVRQDWGPRNQSGQFVTKSEGELRQQWEKESGIAHVVQTVTRKERIMYSVAPSLEAKVTEHLDRGFLMKAADHLRLGVSYGPDGFWRSVAQFESSLSPSEREAWGKFCRSLDADEQAALLYGISNQSRFDQ